MKSRSFVLQACAVGVVTAALLLTACGGLGSGYSYPYYPPYQPSHSSGSASDSSGSSSSTPESSSSESSSEEPSSPASSEPPGALGTGADTGTAAGPLPERGTAIAQHRAHRSIFRTDFRPVRRRANPCRGAAADGQALPQTPQWRRLHFSPAGSNLPGFVSKELYASGQATPAEFVSHLKTRRSGVDWETVLDTQYTQIGIGYAVDADGVPYWELLLLNG